MKTAKRADVAAQDSLNGQQFTTVYHVSGAHNRGSISKYGLIPGAFPTGPRPGKPLGPEPKQHDSRVWVFRNLETAAALASPPHGWGGSSGHNDIWSIQAHPSELKEDPHPGWGNRLNPHRAVIEGRIDPGRLQRVEHYQMSFPRSESWDDR